MFDFFEDNAIELYEDGKTPEKKSDKFSIKDKLNRHLKKQPRKKQSRWLGPSKIWGIDPSEFIYSYFLGIDEYVDFDSRMRMDFGTVAHQTIQNIMVDMGVLEKSSVEEFVIDRRNGMAGLIDGKVKPTDLLGKNRKSPSETVLLEIKTSNDRSFNSIYFVDDIPDYYKAQAEVYQQATGIKTTLFVYVNSATFAIKCLFYHYDGKYYDKVCEKCDLIWRHIAKKELPEYKICTREQWLERVSGIDVPLSRENLVYGKKEEE
jgi:hypothetical protein